MHGFLSVSKSVTDLHGSRSTGKSLCSVGQPEGRAVASRRENRGPNQPEETRPPDGSGRMHSRLRNLPVLLVLAAAHVLICFMLWEPKIHTGGDNAHYILLSEALAAPLQGETFTGYVEEIAPGPPAAHTKYPPGYPLLLAPVSAFLGRNFLAYKLISLLMTTASVVLFAIFVQRWYGTWVWIPLSVAFAVNPLVVDYSHWILSEAPFLFATLFGIYAVDKDHREGGRMGRWFWFALAAGLWCFYIRQIGALFLAGVSLSYLVRKEWRKFFAHGAIGAGLTLPWLIRARLLQGEVSSYLGEFMSRNIYNPEAGQIDLGGLVARLLDNAVTYSTEELPRALAGPSSGWASTFPIQVVAAFVTLVALMGLVRNGSTDKGSALALYFLLTMVAILLFVESVSDVRYLVPLVPLILVYALDGAGWTGRLLGKLRRSMRGTPPKGGNAARAGVTLMILLSVLAVGAQVARVPSNLRMIVEVDAGNPYAGYHPNWRSFMLAADWVHRNTPEDAVVTVRKPRLFNLLTRRRAVIYPFSTDADSVWSVVGAGDYVVVDGISGTTSRYLMPAILAHPDEFQVLHATTEPAAFVLRVLK